ncbi:hypothetical protein ABZ671_01575 [Micromonospora sp. NPDC006766]|uniref:hypothetical protein n=1 Tax=Micromonospora sp. NPDC006766 TaxID=3154778 RepID=UPI0033DF9F89
MADFTALAAAHRAAVAEAVTAGHALTLAQHNHRAAGGSVTPERRAQLAATASTAETRYREACERADQANAAATAANPNAEVSR